MNYKQAIEIMSDLVPKNLDWSLDLEHWYCPNNTIYPKHQEIRKIWLGNPIEGFFGDRITWQSAVDEALVALRNEGLIK